MSDVRRRGSHGSALFALLVLLACAPSQRATVDPEPNPQAASSEAATPQGQLERRFALLFGAQTVGDVLTRQWRDDDGNLHVEDESELTLTRVNGGVEDRFQSQTRSHTVYDPSDALRWEEETVSEGGVDTITRIEIDGNELVLRYRGPNRDETERFALPDDYRSSRSVVAELVRRHRDSGKPESMAFAGFNSESRTFERHEATVVGPTVYEHSGSRVQGWTIEVNSEDGAVVHSSIDDQLMAMEIDYQGSFTARWVDTKPTDLGGVITSEIEVIGKAHQQWWRLRTLDLEVTIGGDEPSKPPIFVDGHYHGVTREGDRYRLSLRSTKLPADHRAPPLPMKAPKDVAKFLGATAQSQSDDTRIEELAHEIIGPTDDSLIAAQRITNFVFQNLEKKSGVRGSATATEVMESGQGDCTEHASLVVALLRAAGLPARSADGIVFGTMADGRTVAGYHAWAEVWVGRWVGVDATVGELGTSARYLHFGYTEPGEPSTSTALIRTVGRTKIEVKGYELF